MEELILNYIVTHKLELFAALTGLICVWFNARNNHWGWFFGIISVTPYIYVFYEAGLYGDSILSLFYLVVSIIGWYHWLFGGKKTSKDDSTELPITKMPLKYWLWSILVGVAGVFGMGYWFSSLPDAAVPYWDAFTTSFSVVAQFLLVKKWIENWLFWIVIDVVCVGIYYYKGLYFTMGLYAVLVGLAIWGYMEWRKQVLITTQK